MSARKSSEVIGTDSFVSYKGYFLPSSLEEARIKNQELNDFTLNKDDVLVVGFPKSGTTRMTLLLREMYDDWGLIEAAGRQVVPLLEWSVSQFHIEGATGIARKAFLENPSMSSSRRLIKSRLPYPILPRQFREDKVCKAIYMTRNPKDVCMNYFHFEKSFVPLDRNDEPIEWNDFVQAFVDGLVVYGPWLNHVIDWMQHCQAENILHVSYEELMHNPAAVVEKIVAFLDRPLGGKTIQQVIGSATFTNEGSTITRGATGEWRKVFSKEENALVDRDIGKMLKAKGFDFLYEPCQ
ncbi:sulfotransferase 1B1-like [Ptychodera flava]|uniref:sulfotransferase 1B1-like n=1 Tax=Ptychodera flava TaxID=63121 RepID=UPI003969C9EF